MEVLNSDEYLNELRQKVFANFIFDISQFLNKKEKMLFREISKSCVLENFPYFQINLNITEDEHHKLPLEKLTSVYKNIEKLCVEKMIITNDNITGIEKVIKNNRDRIKVLNLSVLEYSSTDVKCRLFNAINKIETLTEVSFSNIGESDALVQLLQEEGLTFSFANRLQKLKIDNMKLNQAVFLIKLFPCVTDLTVENCSLDEDLLLIAEAIISSTFVLTSLNLSNNGLSSTQALESLKSVLKRQNKLKSLVLKGLWFHTISQLEDEFRGLNLLESIEMCGSKYVFNDIGSFGVFKSNALTNLKSLNLCDSRLENNELDILLSNLKTNGLEELNLFRSLLTNEAIDILLTHVDKLQHIKYLNISFNSKINSKGFNKLLDNIHMFKGLRYLDMRSTGVFVKYSKDTVVNFILNKTNVEVLDMCLNSHNDNEYADLIKTVYNKLEGDGNTGNHGEHGMINLKIFFKLNKTKNVELLKKISGELELLYQKYNLLIR
jgi:hypothetical protein